MHYLASNRTYFCEGIRGLCVNDTMTDKTPKNLLLKIITAFVGIPMLITGMLEMNDAMFFVGAIFVGLHGLLYVDSFF